MTTKLWYQRRASMLVRTSVQDLESSLPHYEANDWRDVRTLQVAL